MASKDFENSKDLIRSSDAEVIVRADFEDFSVKALLTIGVINPDLLRFCTLMFSVVGIFESTSRIAFAFRLFCFRGGATSGLDVRYGDETEDVARVVFVRFRPQSDEFDVTWSGLGRLARAWPGAVGTRTSTSSGFFPNKTSLGEVSFSSIAGRTGFLECSLES